MADPEEKGVDWKPLLVHREGLGAARSLLEDDPVVREAVRAIVRSVEQVVAPVRQAFPGENGADSPVVHIFREGLRGALAEGIGEALKKPDDKA